MPDLDLIKQEEQGVRVRHGRFARGTVKKTPRMVPMAEIYEEAGGNDIADFVRLAGYAVFGDVFGDRPAKAKRERIADKTQNQGIDAIVLVSQCPDDNRRRDKAQTQRQKPRQRAVKYVPDDAFARLTPVSGRHLSSKDPS